MVEDRGRHTHRGSHSSSHDSRRIYLPYAHLEKSPIFEERAHKHDSRRSDRHRGSNPNESSSRGRNPRRRMVLFH
jgi:hypothetical protein